MDAQESVAHNAPTSTACLLALPVELVVEILTPLSVGALATVDGVCASLHVMARCDRLWAHLYRRDFGRATPPYEHANAASHGRHFRWLYMIEIARQRKRPIYLPHGRYIGAVPSTDGVTCESGEWAITFDGQTNVPRLVLDGYAAATYALPNKVAAGKSGTRAVDPDVCLREGIWCAGTFVGPGLVVEHKGHRYRADRFGPNGIQGQGEADYGDGDRYTGSFNGLMRHGLGTYTWADSQCFYGEWASGRRNGRGIISHRNQPEFGSYAGQFVESKYVGTGVRRSADGTIKQSTWPGARAPSVYAVERKPHAGIHSNQSVVAVTRTVRPDSDNWRTDYADAHGHILTRAKDAARVASATSADVVIGGPTCMILTAIDDAGGPRLAGRRIWGHTWTATPDTRRRDFAVLPADPHSQEARLWAAYLASPHCLVDPEVAADCARALVDSATKGAASLDWRPSEDDCDPTVLGLGLPFGQVLPIKTEKEDAGRSVGVPRVRCFLTGALVPAADCAFVSSGRLYARDHLAVWHRAAGPHRDIDPETGVDLCAGRDWRLSWCAWMAKASPRLLAWAVRDTAARYPRSWAFASERVRAIVAETMGTLDERRSTIDPWAMMASGRSLSVPGPTEERILGGFDGLVIRHIEVRHPAWDPRGPWRLGPPADPPADPTLQPFEAEDRDPAPTAYLQSHSVVVADVGTASFLGSRLTAVHFFGQRFDGASFAGATLTACVFVDCRFYQTAYFDAAVGGCAFCNCLVVDDPNDDTTGRPLDQEAIAERIHSMGVL
ncbi:F-box domain protein [Pandoravirus inopinatum]|uniref:F-box domain protein n=1 Tax=Pandoravirus inopinatum TaxID=1605721 RepID=A0A0B5J8T6_9VIRU|nr:F-box domain protein [Pandoravirus inopinatum]AJF98370.1 F-box domain protein [Pandoravirus inopinatum]